MEYIQWKTGGSKDKGVKEPINWTYWVILRFNPDERTIKDFDQTFEKAAETFGFKYKIEDKGNTTLITKESTDGTSKVMFHSEDLNEALNMAMKIFEVYLTVRNQ